MLVSGVQQSDSVIYIFSDYFSIIGYYKVLNIVPMFFFFFLINLFFYLFLAPLGLRCCPQAFSSGSERGATLRCGARAPHCGGFPCCGARDLGVQASVVGAHGLQ